MRLRPALTAVLGARVRRAGRLLLPALLLTATACGPLRRGGDRGEAWVIFRNDSGEQATVYAVTTGAQPIRLGTVFALRTETLRVPSSITSRGGGVRILVTLLARREQPSTEAFTLFPGTAMEVRLSPSLGPLSILPADVP